MNRKTKRNIAVVAGLTAVLTLSPVAGALTTAHADETAPETVSAQSVEGVDPQSFSSRDWDWYKGDWHFGNWLLFGVYHPKVDFNHNGRCDLCWSWIGDHDCGGDEKPEQQETLTVNFHFVDGTVEVVQIDTPKGEQVPFGTFVDKLDDQYDGITWYWTQYEGAEVVSPNSQLGGEGHHVINVYEHKAVDPVPVYYTVTFDDMVDGTVDQSFQVEEGSTVDQSEVKTPTRDGYTFDGWYVDKEYTAEFDFNTPIKENKTVYAKWAENEPTDPDNPGTDPDNPGTDPDNPGTDPENPGTDDPGDDTPNPGDDTINPGDGSGDQGGDNTDQGNDTTKPAGDATSTDDGSNDDADAADEDAIPNTGDATVAVSGIAALGTAAAGLGIFLRRRS